MAEEDVPKDKAYWRLLLDPMWD